MKKTIALPVPQAKEGRKTSALENYLIRFFERELEVKLTRREMWQSVRFVASLFVLLFALSTGEPLPVLPALALAAYAYRRCSKNISRRSGRRRTRPRDNFLLPACECREFFVSSKKRRKYVYNRGLRICDLVRDNYSSWSIHGG